MIHSDRHKYYLDEVIEYNKQPHLQYTNLTSFYNIFKFYLQEKKKKMIHLEKGC